MLICKRLQLALKFCSIFLFLSLLAALSMPQTASGQALELNGGWSHVTGDFGTDGYEVGAAWWFTKRLTLAGNYESTWDNSTLTAFQFSQAGATAVHTHLQSVLLGPRVFFSTDWTTKHKLNPFGEAEFGVSDLSQKVTQGGVTVSNSDNAFSWMIGGGAEYLLSPHWSARGNLDLLRTHLESQGQSRFRFVLGFTYTFGPRD